MTIRPKQDCNKYNERSEYSNIIVAIFGLNGKAGCIEVQPEVAAAIYYKPQFRTARRIAAPPERSPHSRRWCRDCGRRTDRSCTCQREISVDSQGRVARADVVAELRLNGIGICEYTSCWKGLGAGCRLACLAEESHCFVILVAGVKMSLMQKGMESKRQVLKRPK